MKTTNENYKHAYNKLYSFLRTKHPEVLIEYRVYLEEAKARLESAIDFTVEH